MYEFLKESFERLIDQTDLSLKRYLYEDFQIGRLTGLVGPRGVGKTTLLLQFIKENLASEKRVFYFSADSLYFREITLLEFINQLYKLEGHRFFFIDEVHKYKNWNQELKNLYDSFPDIKIVYSGSSMLDIIKGSYDLSRRTTIYHLPGMSFREYLHFLDRIDEQPISFSDLILEPQKYKRLGLLDKILGKFQSYLATGYYPFSFEDPHSFYERVMRMIEKIIFEDIANFHDLKTPHLHLFKRMLSYLVSIPPGEVNINSIAKHIGIAHQTTFHYLTILEQVGLLRMIYPLEGGSQQLKTPHKIFLHNTTLLNTFQQYLGIEANKGNQRELFFIQALKDAQIPVYFSKRGDYRTEKLIFEIGGKNKTAKQLSGLEEKAFLVKDDVLVPGDKVIPLFLFGFLY